jgi:hypothetical protein
LVGVHKRGIHRLEHIAIGNHMKLEVENMAKKDSWAPILVLMTGCLYNIFFLKEIDMCMLLFI